MAAPTKNVRFDSETLCKIEATVPTGLENLSRDEVIERFGVAATANRGNVRFEIPINAVEKVLELNSVENVCVVLKEYPEFKFAATAEEALNQLSAIIPEVDWEFGLEVWRHFYSFPYDISSTPQEQPSTTPQDAGGVDLNTQISTESTTETVNPSGNDQISSESETDSTAKQDSENAEPAAKQRKHNPLLPSFRATCYRSGGKHVFQSPEAARHFGGAFQDYFGWNVDMKQFNIEVILNIQDNYVFVALGLTRESLHRRNIQHFGPTTLRPTIAYSLLRLCKIQPGDVVCDPMCGGGTIPIEASINWPEAFYWCGDIHKQAWARTQQNIEAVNVKRTQRQQSPLKIEIFKWDVCELPLKKETIDVFITDLPFGKRSGSRYNNWKLYPMALTEMARVCKSDGGRACILTQDKKCILKTLQMVRHLWKQSTTLWVNIGGLSAGVYLLYRTRCEVQK